MGWFTRSKKIKIPTWHAVPEDFITDDLEGYLDPHSRSIIHDVEEFLPVEARKHTCIAGGFAAYVAGLTKSSRDVDLFCLDEEVFEHLSKKIPGETISERRGYGTVIKFERNNIKYDLVDSTPRLLALDQRNIPGLLCIFDVNWAMVGINLTDNKLVCHPKALSGTPMVNEARADEHFENMTGRLEKYSKRLVKAVDPEYLEALIKDIKKRQGKKDKMARRMGWY